MPDRQLIVPIKHRCPPLAPKHIDIASDQTSAGHSYEVFRPIHSYGPSRRQQTAEGPEILRDIADRLSASWYPASSLFAASRAGKSVPTSRKPSSNWPVRSPAGGAPPHCGCSAKRMGFSPEPPQQAEPRLAPTHHCSHLVLIGASAARSEAASCVQSASATWSSNLTALRRHLRSGHTSHIGSTSDKDLDNGTSDYHPCGGPSGFGKKVTSGIQLPEPRLQANGRHPRGRVPGNGQRNGDVVGSIRLQVGRRLASHGAGSREIRRPRGGFRQHQWRNRVRASRARAVTAHEAIAILYDEMKRYDITPELLHAHEGDLTVVQCILRDRQGVILAESSGRGNAAQAEASALFEGWENHIHRRGFATISGASDRARLIHAEEVASQPALAKDELVKRIARDFPDAGIACLRYEPLFGATDPVWYPAFARFPWYLQHRLTGDNLECTPYLRYATNFGTATGVSRAESLVHALMEAIEGDSFSLALIDWYAAKEKPPRLVNLKILPRRLQRLAEDVRRIIKCEPIVFEITTDLNIPAYCALPSHSEYMGVGGAGASLMPAYALERALGELAQAHRIVSRNEEHDAPLRRMLGRLEGWPVLMDCVTLNPRELVARSQEADAKSADWWEQDPGSLDAQLSLISNTLEANGFEGYYLQWSDDCSTVPVHTVLAPGLETFFLSRAGVPVLPSGRGMKMLRQDP